MLGGRLTLLYLSLSVLAATWAHAYEHAIGLPAWGSGPGGIALAVVGGALLAWNRARPELARWFPRPAYTGLALSCFGLSAIAGWRTGLWLVSPAVAMAGAAFAVAGFGVRHPLLPAGDGDAPPTFHERARFWFSCALPWVAVYQLTAFMRLPGWAFQLPFEDRLPVYPFTSLLYQSTYVAVIVAPFLARTRRELRSLTVSAWVSMAVVFPFYWLVPSTGPWRPIPDHDIFARLLVYQRDSYLATEAFPSFHVLWAIFAGRLMRPAMLGWIYALAVGVSCTTTGMHYVADVLAAFAIAPLFLEPERWLWRPLLGLAARFGWGARELSWLLAYAMLGIVLLSMWRQSASGTLIVQIALIGLGLLQFARTGRRRVY